MPTVLITGANRGLGLEFARQYADDGWSVHACCRNPETAEALNGVAAGAAADFAIHALDVTDGAAIQSLAATLSGQPVDLLLNNAGVMEDRSMTFGHLDYGQWEDVLRINLLAPARIAEAFADNVAASERKLMVMISSGLGSLDENQEGGRLAPGGLYFYRTSKAAVNMMTRNLAHDLKERGITAVVISPGHVRTDMGGPTARLDPAESITGVLNVIAGLTISDSGKFLFYDGNQHAW